MQLFIEDRKFIGIGVAITMLMGCATGPIKTVPSRPNTFVDQRDASSHMLSDYLARTGAPSVATSLVDAKGKLWEEVRGTTAFGSDLPADSATVYRLASVSKVFTALAVYDLSVQGKINLDSGVQKVLPEFRVKCMEDRCAPITIRQLLTHSSGLPRGELFAWYPLSGAQLLEKVAQIRPVYEPGSRTSYSNLGYAILGEIVARASGSDFRSFVVNEILNPLGMRSTGFAPLDTLVRNRARPYSIPGRHPLIQPSNDAAAGMYSSLSDLSRFTTWLLAGAHLPILGPKSVAVFDSLVAPFHPTLGLPEDLYCAFGQLRINQGHRTPYKLGGMDGFESGIFLDLEKKLGVIALSNRDIDLENLGLNLLDLFTGVTGNSTDLPKDFTSPLSRANSLQDLEFFQGDYILGIDYPIPLVHLSKGTKGLLSHFQNQTIYTNSINAGWADLRLTKKWDRKWLFFKKEYPISSPHLGFFSTGEKRYVSERINLGVFITAETPEPGLQKFNQWESRIGTWEDSTGYRVKIFADKGLLFFKDEKIKHDYQLEPGSENFATAGGPCRSEGLNLEVQKDGSLDYRMGIHLKKRVDK